MSYYERQIRQRAAQEERQRLDAERAEREAEIAERRRRNDEAGQALRAKVEADRAAAAQAREQRQAAEREAAEQTMKAQAWTAYNGTRASFEADWPAIRARLASQAAVEQQEGQRAAMRRQIANYL